MKTAFLALFLLATPSVVLSNNINDSTIVSPPSLEYQSEISIDPLFMILGCTILGYERRISERVSLEGHLGFGSMLFVDVKTYYEIGGRYYLGKDLNKGMFLLGFLNGITLQTTNQSANVSNVFFGIGNRWRAASWLAIELFGGVYLSGNNKATFTKVDGNSTTSLDVGGTRLSGTARIGVTF